MAWVGRHGKNWRAQIRRVGHRPISKIFPTKARAWAWAAQVEADIAAGRRGELPRHTLADALLRYASEVSPGKRGARWELYRLRAWGSLPMASKALQKLSEADIAAWRDWRLSRVSPGTVRREQNLLASILEIARREWRWIDRNPARDVRKPIPPPPRKRGVQQSEVTAVLERLTGPMGSQVGRAFRLALETGMRSGELVGLTWSEIRGRVATLPKTKNGDSREVPLSTEAVAILEEQRGIDPVLVFTVSTAQVDALFRKARDAAGVRGLRFHDSRSEAITRLARKLDVLELARVVGHRDPRSLMIYYAPSADELALKLG